MHVAEAQVKSDRASSYLVQLCQHFAHKRPAEYDEGKGWVDFQPGLCEMRAVGDELSLRCEAHSEQTLHLVKETVEAHLARFAWREQLALSWTHGAGPADHARGASQQGP